MHSERFDSGLGFVVLMFTAILLTDIGCYYVGTKFVKRKLAPKQTVHGVLESLNEMIEKQSVQFPDKEQVLLNSNTIAALVPWKCSLPEQRA